MHVQAVIPLSSVSLLYALAAGSFSPRDGLDEAKHRFKFAVRSLLFLPWMLRWLRALQSDSALLAYLRHNPRLAAKLHRPYLRRALGPRARLAALQAHYRLERERFPARCRHHLLQDRELPLASVTGRDARVYPIVLTHRHPFDKEGELSLQLRDPEARTLVTLTFSLGLDRQGASLIIGGLQGPRRRDGDADTLRAVTKAFSGLFPKRVAMEALAALARALKIERIEAVGKAQHIYSSWRCRRHFEADYDGFWASLGGEASPGGYRLPVTFARKDMLAIPSRKRAEYQRRYQLLDAVGAGVARMLGRDAPQRQVEDVGADASADGEGRCFGAPGLTARVYPTTT